MLRELHIQNLAVIQDITVELHPGLNCFTGQTGAGKSLIIGALEILLGLRQPTDMLRKGAAEGRVSGVFHISSENLRQEIANATDLPLEKEPELIIARRLFESGRTSASINGNPITGAMLKQVGEILVDVHGQHDAQYLLKPANQLAVIDEFGGSVELREQFAELFHQRQTLMAQQKELSASRTLRRQQLELYEFQAKEIDDAQLVAGEHQELTARSRLLSNLEKIKRTAGAAYGALYEEEGSIVERLKAALSVLLELTELDESLGGISTQVKEATVSLDDAAFSLRRYVDKLDLDPAELAEVNDRLNLVNRLIDKYTGRVAGAGLDEVLAYRTQIGKQIEELRAQDEDLTASAETIAKLEKTLRTVGKELTAARNKAAEKLVPLVHAQLADLGMKEAKFLIEFQGLDVLPETQNAKHKTQNSKSGASSLGDVMGEMRVGVEDFSTASGMETVEFMIAPNPGQPARPLRRIASGGELSRVMLALKGILAQRGGADRVSVLVFDEIDANVGGRMGTVIGEKLRALAGVHQVLCITHLPQIASFADRHLTIRKAMTGKETVTTVGVMEGEARVQELAEMTSGKEITATSLAQARELLETAGRGAGGAGAARKEKVARKR
ncbi:MAG TPA: DNA repair protein RecN [Phycisphaerae bacterium]|nr:DNA repair protein RecN [Phycisphaerae bacterium]